MLARCRPFNQRTVFLFIYIHVFDMITDDIYTFIVKSHVFIVAKLVYIIANEKL